jgi:RNA polymerase subunit RPABC4/transcription elongation factor Spt4
MTAETREWMGLIDVTTPKPSEAQAKLDEKIAVAISVTFAIRIFFQPNTIRTKFS